MGSVETQTEPRHHFTQLDVAVRPEDPDPYTMHPLLIASR